jgi:LmbE family N-acetylglucosaminyl deacetylase
VRLTREKALGVVHWLGVGGRRRSLEGDVAIVSPHLDDAVFSLGAAMSRAARAGARPFVLTVLAGDPASAAPAGEWDAEAGFRTAGEAAATRRAEDAEACRLLGVRAVWLPFSDHQYERGAPEAEILDAVVEAVGDAAVLVPGFPLLHEDHRWLSELLDGAWERGRVGVYAEQPYAAAHTAAPPHGWTQLSARLSDQRRKLAAVRAYRSQMRLLGRFIGPMFRFEARTGGESAAWDA